MTTRIHVAYHGHTAWLTLESPPANTWSEAGLATLARIMDDLHGRPEIVALVLTGAGEKFFCAGADLHQFASGDAEVAQRVGEAFGRAFDALADFAGVSIAAINGFAMGGGLELALACDIRIAEQQAVLALPEASVGLLPCAGGTQRLTELVGPGWAKRMILCGERVDAPLAHQIGLVEQLVPRGHGREAARLLAEQAERQSPAALRACKRLINEGRHRPQAQVLPLEREQFTALFSDPNQREGVQAFLAKRPARWRYREGEEND